MELDEGDEILKEVLGESDSSISSLDVSEDEGKSSETNTKKRKRDKQESEPTEEADTTDTILYVSIVPTHSFLPPASLRIGTTCLHSTS